MLSSNRNRLIDRGSSFLKWLLDLMVQILVFGVFARACH